MWVRFLLLLLLIFLMGFSPFKENSSGAQIEFDDVVNMSVPKMMPCQLGFLAIKNQSQSFLHQLNSISN